ncbi:MAG: PHP domain-containing protein [Bacteroidales bacterium]
MKTYRADLHIHTVLSPCGDLEMSPENIVAAAKAKNLDIIGITDHNSTRHCRLISKLAGEQGIFVLCGAEITSEEEVHCLAFMPDFAALDKLQDYLDAHLPDIKNDVNKFGYQVQVDEEENIIYEEEKLLISAIDQNIDEIADFVQVHGGIFIPAHINRPMFGLISQLGFVPPDLRYDALEISRHVTREGFLAEHPYLASSVIIRTSDAHFPENLGEVFTTFELEAPSFDEIRMAMKNNRGRKVIP